MNMLDLVVTHYNEPWEDGQKYFDMLSLQRGVNLCDFQIIIVQDGEENALPWDDLLKNYPFEYKVITIPHGGVSRARNAGLDQSNAEWIMFCDFDDMFSNVHALRKYFESMSDDTDMIYAFIQGEEEGTNGRYVLETYMDNDTFIHGKMFRREFMIATSLRFEPGVTFSEDTLFCHVMKIVINQNRKHEIPEILYTRCWRDNSVCRSYENNFWNAVGLFRARKALIREYYNRNCIKNFTGTVVKTALDYYYAITCGNYPEPEWFEEDFWMFWRAYGDVFESANRQLVMYENDLSFHEAVHKGFVMIPTISFYEWLDRMKRKFSSDGGALPDTDTVHPRIAVYHATRNMYPEMYASMKSLVLNSNVEKIYFLIEDDTFPYDVPECVEIINVSDQQYISKESPNYDCCWTWMVMLRAAFPKIFTQHDVILSLDVDTIIAQNIDDIWNTDLTDAYYAAVKETKSNELYGCMRTNMGVCLLNLKKLREDGMDDRILNELNTVKHVFTEQDVFNEFCSGHFMTLPSDYNASAYTAHAYNERITHYAGFKEKEFPLIDRYKILPWPEGMKLKYCEVRKLTEGSVTE